MPKFTRGIPVKTAATFTMSVACLNRDQLVDLARSEVKSWPATRSVAGLKKWAQVRGIATDTSSHGTHSD